MPEASSFDGGKANSLVFTLSESLRKDEDLYAPELDFFKGLDKALYVDVAISSDEMDDSHLSAEEREAWKVFHAALEATGNLLDLDKGNLPAFQKVAEQLMFLPSLMSRHPDSARFNRRLLEDSRLSERNVSGGCLPTAQHLAHQSWPVRYAYGIISAIDLTLDTSEVRLPEWAAIYGYGVKPPISMSCYEATARKLGWDEERKRLELPHYVGSYTILPAWTQKLEKLRCPFNAKHILDYWQCGKEMILEELPDFQARPEWRAYHHRKYNNGSKKGAIQQAIFKDILAAMRTVAGVYKRRSAPEKVPK